MILDLSRRVGLPCAVDFVFCIDGSSSMAPIMEEVKKFTSILPDRVQKELLEKNRIIVAKRAKVIVFRSFESDNDALTSSPFFVLPDEVGEFQSFVDGIQACGGGEVPRNSLAALAEAINSEWTDEGVKQRHIIVLITDAAAKWPEESFREHPQYPKEMPDSLNDLTDWWNNGAPNGRLGSAGKRLVLFAPHENPWDIISYCWPNAMASSFVLRQGFEAEAALDSLFFSTGP